MNITAVLYFAIALPLVADIGLQDAKFAKLPDAESVTGAGALEGMARALGKSNPLGYAEWKEIKDGPDKRATDALRLATKKAGEKEKPYSFQATAKITTPVVKNDLLLAVFYARGEYIPNSTAQCVFVFEESKAPYAKSAYKRLEIEGEWRKFYVAFHAKQDFPVGSAQVSFQAGFSPQIIQIADLRVLNYRHAVKYMDLPYTPLTYRGRAENAEWRAEANERIEKYRKSTLTLRIHNAKGRSVSGAEVRIRQVRHAYGFGSAVDAKTLLGEGDDGEKYRSIIESSFNKVTLENDLKWPQWESNKQPGLDALAWLKERNIPVRGHTLLWPGWKNLPKDLEALSSDPAKLHARILDHIRDEAGALKGQVSEWDVVNEPYSNTDIQNILGEGILADAFKAARLADPKAQLCINDYGILSYGGADTEHQDAYYKTIKTLRAAGAPISGIGMQGHFNEEGLTAPQKVWEILDRFSDLGIPIQVTEHDIDVSDEEAWADYTRDIMTVCFAHPATSAFTIWGFWEGRHWIPNAAYFAKNWEPRPAAKVWYDLVFKKWWTNLRTWTDYRGRVKSECFLGDYIIEVKYGTMTAVKQVTLKRGGDYIEIELRPPPKVPAPVPGAVVPVVPAATPKK